MNNLAVSLAHQDPSPAVSPASRVSDARRWAEKSLALESSIKPPERTEECDHGCAVATMNLGEFASMEGDLVEAERRYRDAKARSKGIGFKEGTERAEELLQELKKKMQH